MSAENEPSTSSNDDQANVNGDQQHEVKEQQFLDEIKNWVKTDAKFYGRTDDEFLLIFLRGTKFNLKKAKSKMTRYYDNRKSIAHWWANRDVNDVRIKSLLQHKILTAMIENDPTQPVVLTAIASRFGPNLNNFDDYVKMDTIICDIALRRRCCQFNGVFMIFDCRDLPQWTMPHMLSPIFIKNVAKSFLMALPVIFKGIVFLNASSVIVTIVNLIKPLLSKKLKKRFHLYDSDWTQMFDYVPRALIPEEYGGSAGPLKMHEEAFFQEVQAYSEYLLDDNKYGFGHTVRNV